MGNLRIPAFLIQSYLTCPREAWLEYRHILAEQDHPLLALGRLVHERSYARDRKEVFVDGFLKIDLIRGEAVAEVKKTSRHSQAARLQLLYYLYYLKRHKGLELEGLLLFPKERRVERVRLSPEDESRVEALLAEMKPMLEAEMPPPPKRIRYCRTCAFRDFCWA